MASYKDLLYNKNIPMYQYMIPSNRTLWLKLSSIVTLSLSALLLPCIQPLDTAFFFSLISHLLKGWIDSASQEG